MHERQDWVRECACTRVNKGHMHSAVLHSRGEMCPPQVIFVSDNSAIYYGGWKLLVGLPGKPIGLVNRVWNWVRREQGFSKVGNQS